jgi:hypothetical protein
MGRRFVKDIVGLQFAFSAEHDGVLGALSETFLYECGHIMWHHHFEYLLIQPKVVVNAVARIPDFCLWPPDSVTII